MRKPLTAINTAILAAATLAGLAHGGTLTWTGAVNNAWDVNTTANWSGDGTLFINGDDVNFTDAGLNPNITIAPGGVLPGSVTFNNSSVAYSLGGASIGGAGTLSKAGSSTLTLSAANTYSGGTTLTGGTLATTNSGALGSGTLTLAGGTLNTNVDLANAIVLDDIAGNTFAPNGNYRLLSGQISGAGGFTVAGGGGTPGLQLNNSANSFAGNVTINAGTYLRLTNGEVLPNTASVTNNGNLRLDVAGGGVETIAGLSGSGAVWIPTSNNNFHTLALGAGNATASYSGTIGSSGQNNAFMRLAKTGTGTQTLTAASPFSGGTTISQGALVAQNNAALGSGPVTLNDAATGAANTSLFAQTASSGDLVLSNAITVAALGPGTSTIGTSRTGAGRTFFDGLVTLGRDVTLQANLDDRTQFRGGITGTGNVTIAGGRRTTWSTTTATTEGGDGAAAFDFSGDLALSGAGTLLQFNSNIALTNVGTVTVAGGTTLRSAYGRTIQLDRLAGSGTVESVAGAGTLVVGINGGSSTFSGTMQGGGGNALSLRKEGAGTFTLSGTNTYSGTTSVYGGTLRVSSTIRNTSSLHVGPGATLELGAINMLVANHGTPLASSRTITVDAGTLLMNGSMDSRIGNINLQNGAAWNSNRGTVNGWDVLLANTNAGAAIISVTGTGPSTMGGTGAIRLSGQPVFHVEDTTGDSNPDLIVSMILAGPGNIGGTGGLDKTGAGTMRLTAANSYNGTTTVSAGTLEIAPTGSITSNTTVNSGTTLIVDGSVTGTVNVAGTLRGNGTINGATTVGSGGRVAPGNSLGLLTVTGGPLTLGSGSTLEIELANPLAQGITPSGNLFLPGGAVNPAALTGGTPVGPPGLVNDRIAGNVTFAPGSTLQVLTLDGLAPPNLQKGLAWKIINGSVTGDFSLAPGDFTLSGGSPGQFATVGSINLDLPDLWGGSTTWGYYNWDLSLFQSHGILVLVPEPSRPLLLAAALTPLLLRRRRHHRLP